MSAMNRGTRALIAIALCAICAAVGWGNGTMIALTIAIYELVSLGTDQLNGGTNDNKDQEEQGSA